MTLKPEFTTHFRVSTVSHGERPCERVELSELAPDSFQKTHPEGDRP